ncbi:MAG TPA: PfkB family carbohydrate kinase [Candidatus Deferrimicrobium sp.]|nr:PfkB family carbohydrate kinase [Candidatus Deferrimicrobium sp.]
MVIRNSDSFLNQARDQTEEVLKKARGVVLPAQIKDQVLLGIDGYIDNIISVIRVRHSHLEYEVIENIAEWAERIAQSAGSSTSIERIIRKVSAGGFTCNVGKALSTLCGRTQNIHLIGAFGVPVMMDLFQEQLVDTYQCVAYSVGNPGQTDAYEFSDGKIMMSNFENINRLDWKQILSYLKLEFLINEFEASQLWGLGYWSASPHLSEIFSALQKNILPNLSISSKNKFLILDLSDLKKKPRSQMNELINLLRHFEDYVQTVLFLNDRELEDLGSGLQETSSKDPLTLTQLIQQNLNLSFVIAHSPKMAAIASERTQNIILNAFTSAPQFTTSAGDHFSAGVSYAMLAKFPVEILPLLGNCAASFFVRKGSSPTSQDLKQFLTHYINYLEQDVPSNLT